MGPVMHEVIGPYVVGPLGAQPDARTVVQPQTSPLRLFAGHLQPIAPPQALDPLVVDLPAGVAQQGGDPAIAVTAIERRASSIMSATRRSSSSRPQGIRRWVERCCPSTRQARRSEIPSRPRTWLMHWRRREGPKSFPGPPPQGSACPALDRKPPGAAARSPS